MKTLAAALLLVTSAAASAGPLTVRPGESWVFSLRGGDPAAARKVAASARPGKGQIMVTVRSALGTTLSATNNTGVSYVFDAQLLKGGKAVAARACALPAGGRPIFENWPQTADAVRIGKFRPASRDGSCP